MGPQFVHTLDALAVAIVQGLVVLMAGLAAAGMIAGTVGRARRRIARLGGEVAAGPWPGAGRGSRVLLEGGPARFRTPRRDVVVMNGGRLIVRGSRPGDGVRRARAVVRAGRSLRVPARGLGEPEHLGSAEPVWLTAGRRGVGSSAACASSPSTTSSGGPAPSP